MSFAAEVKTELLQIVPGACCENAQNSALLLFGRDFSAGRLSLLTENAAVAEAYAAAVRYFSGVTPEIAQTEGGNYKIDEDRREITEAAAAEVGVYLRPGKKRLLPDAFRNLCCKESFLRGVFLVCGTVTDPDKEYHLEFSAPSGGLAEDLAALLTAVGREPKQTTRHGAHIVYLKNSEEIEDLLGTLGATETAMQVMGAKMYKDIRNTINRKVNFENANLARSMAASNRQYEAIRKISDRQGLSGLPRELRVLARLRMENREASTAELAKMLPEPLTVSGANHRFQRILKIAEQLENKHEK